MSQWIWATMTSNSPDEKQLFIQPYNNYHAPIPGPSTEIFIRIGYEFQT